MKRVYASIAAVGLVSAGLYLWSSRHPRPDESATAAPRLGASLSGHEIAAAPNAMSVRNAMYGAPLLQAPTGPAVLPATSAGNEPADPASAFPKTRFGGAPEDYADASVDEALGVARNGATPIERIHALDFLGSRIGLDKWDRVLDIEMHETDPKVQRAVSFAEFHIRERFAGQTSPGVKRHDDEVARYLDAQQHLPAGGATSPPPVLPRPGSTPVSP